MFRLSSEEGQELAVRHARSLTRYSEGLVHSHVLVDPEDKRALRKDTIFSIFSVFLVDNLCWTAFVPIFPAFFRPQFGFLAVGALFSMKPLAQFIMTSPALAAVDRQGPKTPQLLGTVLLAASLLLAAIGFMLKNTFTFEHLYLFMLAMRALHGCGSALLLAGGLSHVTMCHPAPLQSYALMMTRLGAVLGLLLGPPLGGWMVHTHGDLQSERHENNDLWLLFALLLSLAGFCVAYQVVHFHSGHSIFISDEDDHHHDRGDDFFLSLSDSVTVSLQASTCSSRQHRATGGNRPPPLQPPSSCVSRVRAVWFCLRTPSLCVTIAAGMCAGVAVGALELLLPTFFNEEFDFNPFHQSLFYIFVPLGYWLFSMCASCYADRGVRYKALSSGLCLLSAGFVLFLGVAKSLVLVGLNLFFIGGCLGVVEMSILPLLHYIVEWLDVSSSASAVEMSEASLLLGLAAGPVLTGGAAMAAGGGIGGFKAAAILVGSLGLLGAAAVAWVLPSAGRVAGEEAMDVDGSLFGVQALRGWRVSGCSSGSSGGSFGSDVSEGRGSSGEDEYYNWRASLLGGFSKGGDDHSAF